MKCVAIGDMFLSEESFKTVLEPCGLFDSYVGFEWKKDLGRKETRELIRKIETEGSEAYPLPEKIAKEIEDADVVFIHMCPIGEKTIENAKNLKYIITARGGVENICLEKAKKKGIRVIHCPMHNAHAVAELTVGLMICETRNVSRANYALKHGEWREKYPNSGQIKEIRSSTIGLIGFGAIGRLVVDLLRPFRCRILINDPYVPNEEIEKYGCKAVSKEELLKGADIVSLHGRIGPNDPPIIGKKELSMMHKNSYLINTARAVLVDMDALYEALKVHDIMGAAIDVFPKEPLPDNYPLLSLDNCTLTNHRGGDTIDSYNRAPEQLLEQFQEVLKTGSTKYMI